MGKVDLYLAAATIWEPTMARQTHLRLISSTDVVDHLLAAVLTAEDLAQEHGLDPHTRSTCYLHQCWVHQCISSPAHAIAVTGHRWCRRCECALDVTVDEWVANTVDLYCPRCGLVPDTAANRQVIRACRTSIAAMHGDAVPTLSAV